MAPGAALLGGGALLAVAAYVSAVRRGVTLDDQHPLLDGTTETAALVVLALGALAGFGYLRVAAGAGALVVFALGEKTQIQSLVRRFGEQEFSAALQFGVLALVVLPLLPTGPLEQVGGLEPRSLWTVVLLISGLNFVAFMARRIVGRSRGVLFAGFLGGLFTSTLTTLSFARQSRMEPDEARVLGEGALAASIVMPIRVLVVAFILGPATAQALVVYALPAAVAGALMLALVHHRAAAVDTAGAPAPEQRRSPLHLASAMRLAVLYQVGLWGIAYIREHAGGRGLGVGAALLGIVDMDALTPAMVRLGEGDGLAMLAAKLIAVGLAATTTFKLGLALVLGAPDFRRATAPGLAAMLALLVTLLAVLAPALGS